ncbi:MAG: glutathione S-transferase [Aquabacterium sp.]|uniref:glutathione S-transferase family protein n=1 Tax=Aquabacterium sp. TaxID=1872578 RepID=UPI0027162C20|nr:glutathione S-transferase [Aquabacterium sp.]MDO9003916.1 glutathione S-transferase [Aquabacterium sp.]
MSWTLYTFAMSHYSEKIRWTLDLSRVDYQEVRMTPVFHIGPALFMGKRGKTTLPVLKTPNATIQDSSRILLWLEKNQAPLALIPKALSQDIHAVEKHFDAIGKDVARFLYAASFGTGDAHIIKLWTDDATPVKAAFVRAAYPFIRWAFRRKLNITPKGADRAQKRITEVIDWLEGQLSDGRTYLVGQSFTAADITAASLLAPIACPSQHPVYGDPAYQRTMVGATEPWRDRPALQWVRQMYELHRGVIHTETASRKAA